MLDLGGGECVVVVVCYVVLGFVFHPQVQLLPNYSSKDHESHIPIARRVLATVNDALSAHGYFIRYNPFPLLFRLRLPLPSKKKSMWIQVFNPTRREGKRSNRNIFTIQLRMWLPGHHASQGTRCSLRIHLRWHQQSLPLSRRNLCRAWHQGPS